MKRISMALAIVINLNLVGPAVGALSKMSYAQDDPQPPPQPEPKLTPPPDGG